MITKLAVAPPGRWVAKPVLGSETVAMVLNEFELEDPGTLEVSTARTSNVYAPPTLRPVRFTESAAPTDVQLPPFNEYS